MKGGEKMPNIEEQDIGVDEENRREAERNGGR
jgi:hypothetical protein